MVFALFLLKSRSRLDADAVGVGGSGRALYTVLKGTPINCLLLEREAVSGAVIAAASRMGVESLLVG